KLPVGTPGGGSARVETPHFGQKSAWSWYSSMVPVTFGTSKTWWRKGSRSSPSSASPHRRHASGFTIVVRSTRSGGTSGRECFSCPGCPPRRRPVRFGSAGGGEPGGSDDG